MAAVGGWSAAGLAIGGDARRRGRWGCEDAGTAGTAGLPGVGGDAGLVAGGGKGAHWRRGGWPEAERLARGGVGGYI
jgi:hypothetical protein